MHKSFIISIVYPPTTPAFSHVQLLGQCGGELTRSFGGLVLALRDEKNARHKNRRALRRRAERSFYEREKGSAHQAVQGQQPL